MPTNNHRYNVRRHPYEGGRDFVRPQTGRGHSRGQSQGLRNATPGQSYDQQQWEDEQPTLYPQEYGRVANNYHGSDDYHRLSPQQLPLTAVTLYPQPLYAEPLSEAVNNAIRLSLNGNDSQHQDQPLDQTQPESHSQEVHPEQAPRDTKGKNNTEHGEQTNMNQAADHQTMFSDRHDSMYEESANNQVVDYGLLKAKGHATFINREAAIQAIEGMFQQDEPVTLTWNSVTSTAPPDTELPNVSPQGKATAESLSPGQPRPTASGSQHLLQAERR